MGKKNRRTEKRILNEHNEFSKSLQIQAGLIKKAHDATENFVQSENEDNTKLPVKDTGSPKIVEDESTNSFTLSNDKKEDIFNNTRSEPTDASTLEKKIKELKITTAHADNDSDESKTVDEDLCILEDFTDDSVYITGQKSNFDPALDDTLDITLPVNENLEIPTDPLNVYMKPIVECLSDINLSLNEFKGSRSAERKVLMECLRALKQEDVEKSKGLLLAELGSEEQNKILITSIIELLPKFKDACLKAMDTVTKIKSGLSQVSEVNSKLSEDLEATRVSLQISRDEVKKMETQNDLRTNKAIADSNLLKKNLIDLLKTFDEVVDSELEGDLVEKCKCLFNSFKNDVAKIKEELSIERYNSKKKDEYYQSNNIEILTQEVESLRNTQRKLQSENLSMSQGMQKLIEKNYKYKQNLVLFNTHLKRFIEKDKIQMETISKQKNLIELFQNKLSGTQNNSTVNALRKQNEEIDKLVLKEKDEKKKEKLLLMKKENEQKILKLSNAKQN